MTAAVVCVAYTLRLTSLSCVRLTSHSGGNLICGFCCQITASRISLFLQSNYAASFVMFHPTKERRIKESAIGGSGRRGGGALKELLRSSSASLGLPLRASIPLDNDAAEWRIVGGCLCREIAAQRSVHNHQCLAFFSRNHSTKLNIISFSLFKRFVRVFEGLPRPK